MSSFYGKHASYYEEYLCHPEDMTITIKAPQIIFFPWRSMTCFAKLLESSGNNGAGVFIGVAQASIPDSGRMLFKSYGWFINIYGFLKYSCQFSDSDMNKNIGYGPRKEPGTYVHDGDVIGITMDMKRGELSFIVNGENLGVAFTGIPTDEPLIPCAVVRNFDKCIEKTSVKFISWNELGH